MILLILVVVIIGTIVLWSVMNGISPMPSSPKAKRVLLDHLPKDFEGAIIEAGSGWGTLVFPLAKKYPHKKIIGFETSPIPYLVSKLLQLFSPHKNLKIIYGNFWNHSFEGAGLVVCYLYPGAMVRLKDKLRPGMWLASNTFAVPGMQPFEVHDVNDIYHSKIYIYHF